MLLYVLESELETMVMSQINDIKRRYAEWANPYELAQALGISVVANKLGAGREGAAFSGTIVVNPTASVQARQRFTLYHEIVHHLIKINDELLSILHDQYSSDEDLRRIIERLCNLGAAEFVIPRATMLAAINATGFSISLVRDLSRVDEVSASATCVQLALCAKHRCIAVVCRMVPSPHVNQPSLFNQVGSSMVLSVETAVSSASMKYAVSSGTLIPKGHLIFEAYEANSDKILHALAPIPLRSGRRWEVECEAMRRGTQVFGLFNIDAPPSSSHNQLQLPF